MKIEKIKKSSLPELISEYITKMVANGALQPGDRLPSEREMAELFGVSRPSVREALHALSFSGILEIRSGSGTYLTSGENVLNDKMELSALFKRYTSIELIEVRKIIEIESIELAINRVTPEEISEIQSSAEETIKYRGQGEKYVSADLKFHTAVINATHNRFLSELHDIARNLEQDPIYYHINNMPEMVKAAECHVNVADALAKKDVDSAKQAMREHFELMEVSIKAYSKKNNKAF